MGIQRGDQRQYFQQVAGKTNIGEMALLANEALNTGVSVTQKANESNLANNQIDLSTKFLAKNNEINTKYTGAYCETKNIKLTLQIQNVKLKFKKHLKNLQAVMTSTLFVKVNGIQSKTTFITVIKCTMQIGLKNNKTQILKRI